MSVAVGALEAHLVAAVVRLETIFGRGKVVALSNVDLVDGEVVGELVDVEGCVGPNAGDHGEDDVELDGANAFVFPTADFPAVAVVDGVVGLSIAAEYLAGCR